MVLSSNFKHEPTGRELVLEIEKRLPEYISGSRLEHTYSCRDEALAIARIMGVEEKYMSDVEASALLHDLTKHMPLEEHMRLCEKFGIEAGKHVTTALLHSKTAAYLARELFEINDVVFSAIFHHTTGKEDMGLLDKIIFLADYTEKTRKYEHSHLTREFFYERAQKNEEKIKMAALDKAIVMSIDNTIAHLMQSASIIDEQTVKTRNFILKRQKEQTYIFEKE